MFERTDKLLLGVRKGMDEIRGGGATQGPGSGSGSGSVPSTGAQVSGPASVLRTGSTTEKERARESVWPIIDGTARE